MRQTVIVQASPKVSRKKPPVRLVAKDFFVSGFDA